MSLKGRLSQLQSQAGAVTRPVAQSKPSLSVLRERIAQLESSSRARNSGSASNFEVRNFDADPELPGPESTFFPAEELATELNGELIANSLIRIRRQFALSGRLGSVSLQTLRNKPRLPGETAGARRNVYIDTETTGLSAGSGTLAFLVGIAVVQGDAIGLTQLLITRFSAEAALLSALAECLGTDDQLVSYNGKSYDLPLLISRFRMQAIHHPFDGLPHLDLLHPVRRLFNRRWTDCRLVSLEKNLLGFQRVDDLPGSQAPEAWFTYIRNARAGKLIKVVEHNQQDIVSLAVAHSVLTQAIEQPQAFNMDLYALARWLSQNNEEKARELLQFHAKSLCDDGRRLLGHLLRRSGNWPQAVAIWEKLAARGCTDSLERLAKYHEHVSKDLAAARHCCALLPASAAREHRRQRINAKLDQLQHI